MLDAYNREISYLRVSVTDRCNLRCTYCMPADGIKLIGHNEVLSLEQISDVVRVGSEKFGIKKIRLTGGEPLVRKGIVSLVEMINGIPGIEEICMTTNGILLSKFAKELKEAGLNRVNISLDTLSPEKYRKTTRGGDINDVFTGIEAAMINGLEPVKINVVKISESNENEWKELKEFCLQRGLKIQFIHQMNLKSGTFSQVEGGYGGNCTICNRIRLTANGFIKPCLFSNLAYSINEHGIEKALNLALLNKPEKGISNTNHQFYNIGG